MTNCNVLSHYSLNNTLTPNGPITKCSSLFCVFLSHGYSFSCFWWKPIVKLKELVSWTHQRQRAAEQSRAAQPASWLSGRGRVSEESRCVFPTCFASQTKPVEQTGAALWLAALQRPPDHLCHKMTPFGQRNNSQEKQTQDWIQY